MSRVRVLIVDTSEILRDLRVLAGEHLVDASRARDLREAVSLLLSAKQQGGVFDLLLVREGAAGIDDINSQLAAADLEINMRLLVRDRPERRGYVQSSGELWWPPSRDVLLGLLTESRRKSAFAGLDPSSRRPRKSDILIGQGDWIKALFEQISMMAPTDVSVTICGESGTGKELVARTIHAMSKRSAEPFITVNCAAIPESLLEDELFGHVRGAFTDASTSREGLFAAANMGTIFLDEIGEMPMGVQSKLLRVVQSQEFRRLGEDRDTKVDVRVIAATNRDLENAVAQGEFRQDLYYRISVFPLLLPPLRERPDDVPLLAQHFLVKYRSKVGKNVSGFTPGAMAKLSKYHFPGNVRELENRVHQALVLTQGEYIDERDVKLQDVSVVEQTSIDLSRSFRDLKKDVVDAFERSYSEGIVDAHFGNVARAARAAGIDRKNLWSLLRKHGVDVAAIRRRYGKDE